MAVRARGAEEVGLAEFAAQRRGGQMLTVPATSMALASLGRPLPGAPMLGGFAALTQAVSLDALNTWYYADAPATVRPKLEAARRTGTFDCDYCKGCGICAAECPCGAIEMIPEP